MKTRDFSFDLPEELIAQRPSARRGESRLMTVNRRTAEIGHHSLGELPALLPAGCLAVFNNSRVRKARIFGLAEETGGRVEFLLLSTRNRTAWAFLSNHSRRVRPGRIFNFPEGLRAVVEQNPAAEDCRPGGANLLLQFSRPVDEDYLNRNGEIPLPPYIRRQAEREDESRYQTIYADPPGSAAAPTAGLHFTPELLARLAAKKIVPLMVTLHVGAGTFAPVRTENIEDHRMHEEEYYISESAAETVNREKGRGAALLAVGTTSVRVLESAWTGEGLKPGGGKTGIFIYPGYAFRTVDILFTNFHTPRSSLLMLVSAFAGRDLIFKAYREAIHENYKFFSYGDAMLIL
jgi:S-adenosylmethionine:tRNA ribosyltransferase-isomerase